MAESPLFDELHHLCIVVDAAEVRGRAAGIAPKLHGRLPNRNGFTYFDTDERGAGVILQVRRSST